MMGRNWLILFFLLLFCFQPLFSQKDAATTDSARFYKRIQSYSDKRRFTKFVYRLIFRPVRVSEEPSVNPVVPVQSFKRFEGKVIRNIHVQTLDPFGFDICDTTTNPRTFPERAGNYLHVKSFPITIKNRLIFKKYDTFDSLRVKESMRLIRGQNYIREIFLVPVLVKGTDSVDIYIKTVDVWSIIATGTGSKSGFRLNVTEKNFLGLGHQVQDSYSLDHTNGNFSNSTDYYFSNIFNSYVNAVLHYDTDHQKNYNLSGSLERPFYSIFTKWAGGAYVLDHLHRVKMMGSDSTEYYQNIRFAVQDYWLGKSWQLFRGDGEDERTTSLILSGRISRKKYYESVSPELDTAHLYQNESFFLSSIGLVKRKYKQDRYVFKFGFTEDVPVGRAFQLIAGIQKRSGVNRLYFGAKTFWGNYYEWGYFGSNMEYGTFYDTGPEEGSLTGGITYFTRLRQLGKWKFRQFVKPQFTVGINRPATDRLTLNEDAGIRGFNSAAAYGTQKLFLLLQTQSYAPWNLIGFRIGPYFVYSAGILGTEKSGFKRSPVYSQFGIGLLVKNDFLIMNSFEISVAYFPYIPGVGNDVFKPNPFHTSDVGFRDSDVGKPTFVSYR